jgi:alpha-tubulin suppressor-like RCC1 family protein
MTFIDSGGYTHRLSKAADEGVWRDTVAGTLISEWLVGKNGKTITSVGASGARPRSNVEIHKIFFAVSPAPACSALGKDIYRKPIEGHAVSYSLQPLAAKSVSAGVISSCAALLDGTVRCWGGNLHGAVGMDQGSQVARINLKKVLSIVPFKDATCALSEGSIYCWGGDLGTGAHPKKLEGQKKLLSVSSSIDQLCAVVKGGGVACTGPTRNFVRVGGISDAINVSAGASRACAVTANGHVYCWGYLSNFSMSAPHDYFAEKRAKHNKPILIEGISGAIDVDASASQDCALIRNGLIKCWSYTNDPSHPVLKPEIIKLPPAVSIESSCAILRDKKLRCWKKQGYAVSPRYFEPLHHTSQKLRNDGTESFSIDGLSHVKSVSIGASHGCALAETGGVYCWGDNSFGQLGSLRHWSPFSNTSPAEKNNAYHVIGFVD